MTELNNVKPPSERHPWIALLLRNSGKILALGLFAAAGLMWLDLLPDVSREAKIAGLAFAAFLLPGSYVGDWVQNQRGDPQFVLLVDVAAQEEDGGIASIPLADWRDLEVVDGKLDQWAPMLYAGKNLDLEEMTVEGCWRGTLTDRELLAALSAVEECRGMLEEDSRKLFAIESNLWSIVYRATKDATRSVVNTFEKGTLPDEGEGVDNAVNDALDQFGLLDTVDNLEEADDLDADLDDLDLGMNDDDQPEEKLPRPADD
ncbi:hypothetical protein [Natronosalvus vescus]|uniref:hypothetical protein n=1 Tax=Natronosalvus vescus TaxID=2953881 RepID=UPI00209127CD|nr:hypothetical protein [Natronosalvus vescus]